MARTPAQLGFSAEPATAEELRVKETQPYWGDPLGHDWNLLRRSDHHNEAVANPGRYSAGSRGFFFLSELLAPHVHIDSMARREKRALPTEAKDAAAAQRPRRSSRLSSSAGEGDHLSGRIPQALSTELSITNQSVPPESLWWHTLPLDVLSIIFSYISFRPRLLVVAFVCRRWNRCVEESMDALPRYIPASAAARAIARWPQIQSAMITATPSFTQHASVFSALAQAKSLTSLDIRGFSQRRHVCTDSTSCPNLMRVTGLTRLAMQLYDCRGLTGLITQNAASLQSLSVDPPAGITPLCLVVW